MKLLRWVGVAAATAALLGGTTACSGDDDPKSGSNSPGGKADPDSAPPADDDGVFDGLYVGKVTGSDALVAVVASAESKGGKRDVTVFVCDGAKVVEWFPGSVPGNEFTGKSDDGDAETEATISADAATGTVTLAGGKELEYEALRAAGASGLYDLTVTDKGVLQGATAAGVGVKGRTALETGGKGSLKLADGREIRFEVASGAPRVKLKAGQARVIVLPNGHLTGVLERGQRDLVISG
jgi:hypothetical protein